MTGVQTCALPIYEAPVDDTPNKARGRGKMTDPEQNQREWSEEYWESDYEDENKDFQVVSDPDEE